MLDETKISDISIELFQIPLEADCYDRMVWEQPITNISVYNKTLLVNHCRIITLFVHQRALTNWFRALKCPLWLSHKTKLKGPCGRNVLIFII